MLNSTHKREQKLKKWKKRWKSAVQINEQCCIPENSGKRKKQNQCKTCKQQKRLFIMYIQTKLDGIGKNKVTLTLNKPAYIGICILELEH